MTDPRLPLLLIAAGAWLSLRGWGRLKRKWMIQNLPRSRVRSVAMGLAELEGRARAAGQPVKSPVRQVDSVWHRVRVTERRGRENRVLKDESTLLPFYLDDGTGRILVQPEGAELRGVETCDMTLAGGMKVPADVGRYCAWNGISLGFGRGSIRIREWVLLEGGPVYALGEAARPAAARPVRLSRVKALLKFWTGHEEHRKAIDLNRDGLIQPEEWDRARAHAEEHVARQDLALAGQEAGLVLKRPSWGRIFLIGAEGEKDMLAAQGRPFWPAAGGFLLLGLGIRLFPGGFSGTAGWLPDSGGGALKLGLLGGIFLFLGLNIRGRRQDRAGWVSTYDIMRLFFSARFTRR